MLLRLLLFQQIDWVRMPADILALLAILCTVELITSAKWKSVSFAVVNLIVSVTLFSSTVYYTHFGSVPTYTALLALKQVMQIRSSIESTVQVSHYLYFVDLIVLILVWSLTRKRGRTIPRDNVTWKASVFLIVIVCILLSGRYIRLGDSISNELVQAESLGFLDYQVAAAIKLNRAETAAKNENLQDTIHKINRLQSSFAYQSPSAKAKSPAYFGAAKGKNLIVVQLESFQNFPIRLSLNGQELTPVLNGLTKEGLYFPYVFQQIGQGNTSDAEFMSNTSIYPTGTIAMSMGYGDRELPSLPRLLQKYGYVADTFHVNDVKFWDRIQLYPALHFDHYYDKPFYRNDHFNDFGASDEEMYRVGMEKILGLSKEHKPFYTQFITVSSHFPFTMPEDRKRISLPDSLQGTQLGNYLTAVNYTDYALGTFIERLKQEGLWDDTVLVVYGDHFGLQPQDNDPAWVQSQLGIPYEPRVSRFNIPLIIHLPGEKKGKAVDQTGGQLDIMPTVANLLGINLQKEQFVSFGHDLLNITRNTFGMRYYLPTGSFFNNDILFVPGKGFDDGTGISLKTLKPVTDISSYRDDYDYIMEQMRLSDEYVRVLPKRGL
ncbi:LTA synthase family protein [Cohnella sp. NL03-T5]|uniref:LTA synthase family protein n=2 Tax=Cohnella silvisoli TaxID=2873699 RepID=A0ABV1KTH6_9BACL|nr:LTA synthase family protein [Cohnella silvisoli]